MADEVVGMEEGFRREVLGSRVVFVFVGGEMVEMSISSGSESDSSSTRGLDIVLVVFEADSGLTERCCVLV